MVKKKLGLTPVVEYFANASSVSVPAGVNGMWLTMIGAGGGGGSGRRGASSTNRYGGEGGQGGNALVDVYVPASQLGTTFTVTVPSSGGTGGSAQTTNTTNGNAGGNGGSTTFASGSLTWTVSGGRGGQGGGTAAQTSSDAALNGRLYGAPGGLGSTNSTAGVGADGDTCGFGGAGGGGGGGISSGNAAGAGGRGGYVDTLYYATGGNGGVVGGASPTSGYNVPSGFFGPGAGGGAGNASGAGQNGANAVSYGGGGGGGGASLNGNNSGAGGNGAPGYVRIIWDYRSDKKQLGANSWIEYSDTTNVTGATVPSNIKGLWLFMIGPGGGGGSGATTTSTGTTYGGQGGQGGSVVKRWLPASALGSTYDLTIPARSTGGAGISTSNASGNGGSSRSYITFASGSNFYAYCDGGSPGAGGTSSNGSWPGMGSLGQLSCTATGGPGAPSGFNTSPTENRVAGGQHNSWAYDNDPNGWEDFGGAAGGGAGGYLSSGTPKAGTDGGFSRAYGQVGGALGDGVAAPGSGPAAIAMIPGAGAGGGGAGPNSTSNGQNGADATAYGGGGGGGGAAVNGNTSGAGGKGGPGYVRIVWDYI